MLRLVAITVLGALVLGWLAGGRLRTLAALPVTALPLTFLSTGLIVAARFAGAGVATGLQVAAICVVGIFLVVNAARTSGIIRAALAVVALGWVLNAAVIISNSGMPLSLAAYAASGQTEMPTPGEEEFFAITVADEGTVLSFLGDVIPIAPMHVVVSIGDLFLALGIVALIVLGMRGTRITHRTTPTSNSSEVAMTTT